MRLNIKPLKLDFVNCLEGLMISFASWCNHNYELMFADSWGFLYANEQLDQALIDSPLLGVKIETQKNIHFGYLERYHGIKSKLCVNKTPDEVLEIIQDQLSHGYPTIISLNPFWCPWDDNAYQKRQNGYFHTFMITGIDLALKNLFCVDTVFMKQDVILPIADFQNGCMGVCLTLSTVDNLTITIDLREVLNHTILKLKREPGLISAFDAMKKFAKEVRGSLDIGKEIGNCEDIWLAPLILNISEIINGRVNFKKMLEYIAVRNNQKDLLEILEAMTEIEIGWSSVRGLLIKSYYSPNPKALIDKIAAKIEQAAEKEEIAIGLFAKRIEDHLNRSISGPHLNIEPEVNNGFGKIVWVDLHEYLNNHSFGDPFDNQCSADISGLGCFFYLDSLAREQIWQVKQMKFCLPDISGKVNDSVACMGQTINVPEGRFRNIMILGCGDLGSYSEEMLIEYTDATEQKVLAQFSDHAIARAFFGEAIAWSGRCGWLNWLNKKDFASHIYVQIYDLAPEKFIKRIRLPNCPNIIIFAITLGG